MNEDEMLEHVFVLPIIGLLLEIGGVTIGAYTIREVIFRKGSFDPKVFDSKIFDTGDDDSKLPRHPKTNAPIVPLQINRYAAALSVSLIVIGIAFQLGFAFFEYICHKFPTSC